MDSSQPDGFGDQPPTPESLLIRVYVPELQINKCLQFPSDILVWDVKQQILASLPKESKESFNYGLFCPPSNGKAGKFLDEERRLGDYPFNGPVGYLELKYKRRVYKMTNFDDRQLRLMHSKSNLRRFIDCINSCHIEKITKMCDNGLDPNYHCEETGETPLTLATGAKKSQKLLMALVNGGALLDFRTTDGSTALHRAVERNRLDSLQTLLELGGSPNYKDAKGLTPVYLSVTKKTESKLTKALLHDHAVLGTQDTQGWQEIHQACRNGLVEHLEHLLTYGADMDSRNASGNTPLHVCAVNKQTACAKMLLFRGAQRDALNFANQTPYQVAVIADNLKLAEIIQSFSPASVELIHKPPSYNPRRRSGMGWSVQLPSISSKPSDCKTPTGQLSTSTSQELNMSQNNNFRLNNHLNHHHHAIIRMTGGPPSPCSSERPFSSASSSLSESSSSHRSHEDDSSIVTGDTSDSSGVGSNFETAACSINHPNTTVVCMEKYVGKINGHLTIQPGDVIEVVGSTDCGLLEGYIRNTTQTGLFPSSCVQKVQFRQKHISQVSIANSNSNSPQQPKQSQPQDPDQLKILPPPALQQQHSLEQSSPTLPQPPPPEQQIQMQMPIDLLQHEMQPNTHFNSSTAPRIKKAYLSEPRTVLLDRAKGGFGFKLRGATASSPLMQMRPSLRYPALQYLDVVDPGGVADKAGLLPGDYLLAINGQDVTRASHEHVVQLIRSSNNTVSMTVVTLPRSFNNEMVGMFENGMTGSVHENMAMGNHSMGSRQCSTLPRRMSGPGYAGRMQAPKPPTRDPRTTLSVGRARAKSMVAGLEGNVDKDDEEVPTKSSSAESIHQQTQSAVSTPTQGGPGTPIRFRTASIKARPSSSRITAAELEELFQRQQGANASNRCSALMTTSHFQSDLESDGPTPPTSPSKGGPIIYASIAEMKRKKTKNGTLRGRAVAIPTIGSDLRRNFHSSPDLADLSAALSLKYSKTSSSSGNMQASWSNTFSEKSYRSNDNMHNLHSSMQRLVLPPPNHPPPPPPTVGQLVKVDVSRRSEYDTTQTLQKQLQEKLKKQQGGGDTLSSFKPASHSPYSTPKDATITIGDEINNNSNTSTSNNVNPYAKSEKIGQQAVIETEKVAEPSQEQSQTTPAPPIPDPDYSLSESDDEGDNSVRSVPILIVQAKKEEIVQTQPQPTETSGNSNTSGSSTSSNSVIDEIQKIQAKLKSSKSYPNDFGIQKTGIERSIGEREGDSSSSGVSSDHEHVTQIERPKSLSDNHNQTLHSLPFLDSSTTKVSSTSSSSSTCSSVITTKLANNNCNNNNNIKVSNNNNKKINCNNNNNNNNEDVRSEDEDDQSPSPPLKGFQRHNSLTRKQAAFIAANRAKAIQMQQRHAVTLAQLPPPIEADSDEADNGGFMVEPIVAPPPPEFSDNINHHRHHHHLHNQNPNHMFVHHQLQQGVRIVGAVPKMMYPREQKHSHQHRHH